MINGYILEAIGYLGSVLVLVSMLMTSVVKLRIINLIGSAIFTVYALLIASYPTALLNACLVIVNIHQLRKLHRAAGRSYDFNEVKASDGFVSWFINKYHDDIKQYFPVFDPDQAKDSEGFAVFYEDQAAGILLGRKHEETLEILLDYTTPAFRDTSVGTYLYDLLPARGISCISCKNAGPKHELYMNDMGFESSSDGAFIKQLK